MSIHSYEVWSLSRILTRARIFAGKPPIKGKWQKLPHDTMESLANVVPSRLLKYQKMSSVWSTTQLSDVA
jgi:hypothetical protein